MKIIDRYLLSNFSLNFLFGLFAFICIFIIIDLIENLGGFVDSGASALKIGQYYLYFIPEIISLMVPVALLLASLFTVGKMTNLYEITAIKVGGVSTLRILSPFMIFSFLVTLILIWFSGWIVPLANKAKTEFEAIQLGRYVGKSNSSNIVRQDSESRMITIGWFDGAINRGFTVSVIELDQEKVVRRWDARTIEWNQEEKRWKLTSGIYRNFVQDTTYQFESLDYITFNFKPRDLINDFRNINQMTYFDLSDYIDSQRLAGFTELDKYLVAFYSKVSFPFACMVVVLFGVPLSSRKKRGGLAVEFGIALLICFVYLSVAKVAETFGQSSSWDPLLAAWFANIIFLIGGIYLLFRVDKQ